MTSTKGDVGLQTEHQFSAAIPRRQWPADSASETAVWAAFHMRVCLEWQMMSSIGSIGHMPGEQAAKHPLSTRDMALTRIRAT